MLAESSEKKDRTSVKQKIGLIALGLFLCLVFLEAGLRLGGLVLSSIKEYRNAAALSKKGDYRILCLGESTTDREWPPHLDEILNNKNLSMKFTVIDKGRAGTKSSIILSHLPDYLDAYQPDMIIVMMGINDDWNVMVYDNSLYGKMYHFFENFRIFKLAKLLKMHIRHKLSSKESQQAHSKRYWDRLESKILPENMASDVELGVFYKERGESDISEKMFKKALAEDPENDNAYVELGVLYYDLGRYKKAEEMFKKALAINPRNDNTYIEYGCLHWGRSGDLKKAEEMFKKAIVINPENDRGYVVLGDFYIQQNKHEAADRMFAQVATLDPVHDDADEQYAEIGASYLSLAKFSKAKEFFARAIMLNPHIDTYYSGLASAYEGEGEEAKARTHYKYAQNLRTKYYDPVLCNNYQRLKEIAEQKGLQLVCVQYPMRELKPLKKMLGPCENVIFIDNEEIFKEAVEREGWNRYFRDIFAGDFGHCTLEGNRLLAENIADTILEHLGLNR